MKKEKQANKQYQGRCKVIFVVHTLLKHNYVIFLPLGLFTFRKVYLPKWRAANSFSINGQVFLNE